MIGMLQAMRRGRAGGEGQAELTWQQRASAREERYNEPRRQRARMLADIYGQERAGQGRMFDRGVRY